MGRSLQQSLCAAPTPTLSTSFQNTLCRAKQGRDPEALLQIPRRASFRAGSKSPKLHRKGQPDSQNVKNSYVPPIRLPCAVKFRALRACSEGSSERISKRNLGVPALPPAHPPKKETGKILTCFFPGRPMAEATCFYSFALSASTMSIFLFFLATIRLTRREMPRVRAKPIR